MQEQGLIAREPNPGDARSPMITLLPAGRRAIQEAAPQHVEHARRHFVDLFTPAELEIMAELNERVIQQLTAQPDAGPTEPDHPQP
jgi:DNA-binding MarR family transcriptional regulator